MNNKVGTKELQTQIESYANEINALKTIANEQNDAVRAARQAEIDSLWAEYEQCREKLTEFNGCEEAERAHKKASLDESLKTLRVSLDLIRGRS